MRIVGIDIGNGTAVCCLLEELPSEPRQFYKEYSETVGLGLTDEVRLHAKRLCDLQREEIKIEKELDPLINDPRSTKNSKNSHTKRYLSRRRFEKILGIAPTENSSGRQKSKKIIGGSSLCRKLFWQWIYTRIETPNGRTNNPVLCEIHEWMNRPKLQGTPYRLLTMKTASHAARMLFKRLVEELTEN